MADQLELVVALEHLAASIQCLETLRLLIGSPPQLAGRLLRFSGQTMEFRTLQLERNPHCPVCGDLGD